MICTLEIAFSRNNYSASSLNNLSFLLFKYQQFVVFSFDILRNPEQRKFEFFYTAFFINSWIHCLDWHLILSHLVKHMNFKADFIQICFRCTADFIQPSFHLFCDVVISWSVSINRAMLCLFFDLATLWMHMPVWYTSTIELKIKLLSPSLSAVPFSSCSRSWYRGIATSSFPTSQASCRVSFPPCCSHAEVARITLTLISPICA